jgi:hypothetical protein
MALARTGLLRQHTSMHVTEYSHQSRHFKKTLLSDSWDAKRKVVDLLLCIIIKAHACSVPLTSLFGL